MPKDLSTRFYRDNKERLPKKARERYQSHSIEEKEKRRKYSRERYKNLSE